jgi:DNA repair exonuclease SbcCD ATPase subunit
MKLISNELKPFSDEEFNDSDGTLEDSSSEAEHSLTHKINYLYNEENDPAQQLHVWMGNKQPHIQHITNSERNCQFVSHSESQQLQYDQLEVLYRAQGSQISKLQQEVEEGEKKIRILKHHLNKFRMELDDKDSKCREALERISSEQNKSRDLQQNIELLERQLDSLAEARDNALADLQTSQMTVDSLHSQLNEMSRSETLGRVRRQQEEAMLAVEKRHEQEKLTLRLELDRVNEILASRCDEADKLREELESVTRHLEEERLRNGDTIGKLTANLHYLLRSSTSSCTSKAAVTASYNSLYQLNLLCLCVYWCVHNVEMFLSLFAFVCFLCRIKHVTLKDSCKLS